MPLIVLWLLCRALGHGANRGKVYYLHPELFKVSPLSELGNTSAIYTSVPLAQYACDGDDKTWLYENKLLPVHGGKVCVWTNCSCRVIE